MKKALKAHLNHKLPSGIKSRLWVKEKRRLNWPIFLPVAMLCLIVYFNYSIKTPQLTDTDVIIQDFERDLEMFDKDLTQEFEVYL